MKALKFTLIILAPIALYFVAYFTGRAFSTAPPNAEWIMFPCAGMIILMGLVAILNTIIYFIWAVWEMVFGIKDEEIDYSLML